MFEIVENRIVANNLELKKKEVEHLGIKIHKSTTLHGLL